MQQLNWFTHLSLITRGVSFKKQQQQEQQKNKQTKTLQQRLNTNFPV